MTTTTHSPSRMGFYASVAETPREDVLRAYLAYLETRNGGLDTTRGFPAREQWLAEVSACTVRHRGHLDPAAFTRYYAHFDIDAALSPTMLALLAFVKMNAGEAYGVEVLSRVRQRRQEASDLFAQVERVVTFEESYHTRILVGAAQHFGIEARGAWKPPLPLKLLIGTLAHAPRGLFHPVLLSAEIAGVFTFQWALHRVGAVFRDEPALRERLEQRLLEILVDEVGHIAFNRLAVGPAGLAVARALAPLTLQGVTRSTPELIALGLEGDAVHELSRFDLQDLPAEVRRRAFFA